MPGLYNLYWFRQLQEKLFSCILLTLEHNQITGNRISQHHWQNESVLLTTNDTAMLTGMVSFHNCTCCTIKTLRLKEEYRVVVQDGWSQETLCLARPAWYNNLNKMDCNIIQSLREKTHSSHDWQRWLWHWSHIPERDLSSSWHRLINSLQKVPFCFLKLT